METIKPLAFVYSDSPRDRRHGPHGYSDLQSFRPWLRDEFSFRCVYCLIREQWGRVQGEFDIEHFEPNSISPDARLKYENLVYACHTCNLKKGSGIVADPLQHLTTSTISIKPDGSLVGLTIEAKRIIDKVALNSATMIRWRLFWIRMVEIAATYDLALLNELMGYPSELPDLSKLNPPVNNRPAGIDDSFFEKRRRGELEQSYLC